MSDTRIHPSDSTGYALYRVFADGHEEPVEGIITTDHIEGIEHGHRLSREEPGSAFSLYHGERRVAKFSHHRIALRVRPGAVEMLVSS